MEIAPSNPSSIIPVYQKHSLDIGGGLIEENLAAISQKPESGGHLPGKKGKCGARNSFRNIFRPDMTYCQGSARTLRETLVQKISTRQTASMPAGIDEVYEVLDKEEHVRTVCGHGVWSRNYMKVFYNAIQLPPQKEIPVKIFLLEILFPVRPTGFWNNWNPLISNW